MSYNLIHCNCGCTYAEADGHNCNIEELEANINTKADFIDATINQLAASDQRIEELEAKLSEAEVMIEAQQKDYASNNVRFAEAEYRAKAAEQRVATLEAALPAVYQLALGDAAERLLAAVTREYKDHREYRNAIRTLPTPTADELMARIQTGETDE